MKRAKFAGVLLLTVFLMAGCGSGEESLVSVQNEEDNTANVTQDTEPSEDVQDNQQIQDDEENNSDTEQTKDADDSDENTEAQDSEQRDVSIYYIGEETGEPASETVMISDENDIWAALQDRGVLTDDCELLGFDVNEEENTLSINFNSALGDRIRSFGTTGETEILGCLVNTYLDAYDCDGAKLLEEGKTFETSSGANFDGFTGRIEF